MFNLQKITFKIDFRKKINKVKIFFLILLILSFLFKWCGVLKTNLTFLIRIELFSSRKSVGVRISFNFGF